MVGRDILVGGLLGLGHTLTIYFMQQMPGWFGMPQPPNDGADPNIQGFQALLSTFISQSIVASMFLGLGFLFLLLLFYALLRKQWLAALALVMVQTAILGFAFASAGPWPGWFGALAIAIIYIIAATRFGLLTVMSLQLFFDLTFHYPITGDFSAWYTVFVLVALTGLAFYSFYTSLAGQPLFRGQILQD